MRMTKPESIQKHGPTGLLVTVSAAAEMEEHLTAAVEQIMTSTHCRAQGILVTRQGPGTFIVDVSADVPTGTVYEHDATRTSTPPQLLL